MLRSKHSSYSLLRYQFNSKVTYYLLLLLLSLCAISILLIIFYGYCIINQRNVRRLTFFKRSKQLQRHQQPSPPLLLEGHVDVSTSQELRDWHTTGWHIPRDLRQQSQQRQRRRQQQQPQSESLLKIGQSTIANGTTLWPELAKRRFIGSDNNSLKLTGFNVKLSESLPLQRLVPDTRHKKCKTKRYPAPLPSCSIVIVYHNEQPSVLLRTLHSLFDRTPAELLQEIILVNDFSESDNGDDNPIIQLFIKEHFPNKVRHINLSQREGLIRARLVGAQKAEAEVLVFLDAHVEVNENWLPPLLLPIVENSQTSTTPIIDIIKYDSLEYQGGMPSRGGFNWQFNYVQLPLLKREERLNPKPHNNPIMNGGLFAIKKDYFWYLGGYDEGLEIWGAEQYELSFKIWLCGGRLLEVPCSRVGHLYRSPDFAVSYTDRKDDFISKNYKRVAEVWMDEYKEFLYEHIPKLNQIDAGNLTQQKQLRNHLKCKPFKWFMEHIAFDLLKAYPPIRPADFASGAIQSLAMPELCLDIGGMEPRHMIQDVLKPCSPDLKYPYASQKWHLGFRRDLQHRGNCLEVQTWSSRAPIWLWPCHNRGGNQWWFYDRNTEMLIQGKEEFIQRCMEVDTRTKSIFVNYCDLARREQKWHFGYVNLTAMTYFFNDIE